MSYLVAFMIYWISADIILNILAPYNDYDFSSRVKATLTAPITLPLVFLFAGILYIGWRD